MPESAAIPEGIPDSIPRTPAWDYIIQRIPNGLRRFAV